MVMNMNHHTMNYYYKHTDKLTQPEIESLIMNGQSDLKDGLIGNTNQEGESGTKIRSGKVCFLGDSVIPSSVFVKLNNLLVSCKRANPIWDVNITSLQPLQYAEYREGDHYDWHSDQTVPYPDGTIRQLSVVVSLNDPDEYEGGEFEYLIKGINFPHSQGEPLGHGNDIPEKVMSFKHRAGTIIVFPSFVKHRVAPIVSGVRRSLTGWYVGNHLSDSA